MSKIVGWLVMEFLPARFQDKPVGHWQQIGGFWMSYEAAEKARTKRMVNEPVGSYFVMAQYNRE